MIAIRTSLLATSVGVVAALALGACKAKRTGDGVPTVAPHDAGAARDATTRTTDATNAATDAAQPWPQLASLPLIDPVRVVLLPVRPDVPRFDVGGPVIVGDVAVVSTSQLGFAGVDWRRGALLWTKPAGLHVAPPLANGGSAILIGDCINPPELPRADDTLLGCLRVVTAAGVDQSYNAIHGAHLEAFAREPGPQAVWLDGERAVRWRRGERAVTIDLFTGVAKAAALAPPPIRVTYGGRAWDVTHSDGRIVGRERGKIAWQTQRTYTALLGAVHLRDLRPMIRIMNIGPFDGRAELNLLDIDATGSLRGQAAFPVPAISALGHTIDAVGNTAIAVRMDSTLRHDFIVGYAANAMMVYVYPLPEIPRADPVGVAVASDAVIAFHDGDTLTVLPELSSPPTAPGSPIVPLENPTP